MSVYTFAYGWAPLIEALTKRLVEVPSVVGTPGESACARSIYDYLAALPYFQQNPSHIYLAQTRDDAVERYNVVAFVRGQNAPLTEAPTTLLMGHLDTVDIQDYGPHVHLACQPDLLHAATGAPAGYLVGRGALDMKSGVAANMAVLERFAAGEGPQNRCLLFVATPDEEDASRGILSVVSMLPDIACQWGLDLQAAINTDYTAPRFPGDTARYIYAGTIGKLLPSLFVAGVETHAGEPFGGFDPNWLAAEVTRRVDYNPDLCERSFGEVTPPPVSLRLGDLKEFYTVQTALYSWAYYNWFTFMQSPADVLARFRSLVTEAFADLLAEFGDRARRHASESGTPAAQAAWAPQVLTYAELSELVANRAGPDFEQQVADRLMQDARYDLRTFSCRLTEELWRASGLQGPAAVVGFAQVYSPPVRLELNAPLVGAARAAAQSVMHETGMAIQVRHFFPYISDMSFLGCPDTPEALAVLRGSSPGWGRLYRVDHEAHARLNLPVINIGPWGEGAHTRNERVEKAYSFAVVPELIWRTLSNQ